MLFSNTDNIIKYILHQEFVKCQVSASMSSSSSFAATSSIAKKLGNGGRSRTLDRHKITPTIDSIT